MNNQKQLFLPSKLNPVLTRLCQSISYLVADVAYKIRLTVEDVDREKIRALGNARIVYLPNHPSLDDGIALFMFSALNGQLFHYLVARDSFQGWLAHFLPALGCYSMRRGVGDRNSISHTIKLLKQPAMRLVIFPEGGCSYQNDTVIPFRSGAIAMPLQAMSKLVKEEKTIPPIYLVPLSLKYRYLNCMNSKIEQTLSCLERELNLINKSDNFYQRLRNIGAKVLQRIENQQGINHQFTDQNNDWNQRINFLKNNLLEQCEAKLNLKINSSQPMRERVYKIQATLEANFEKGEKYNQETEEFIQKTTFQLLNFDAIYDGYVAEKPNQERFLDTLNRLERSIFELNKPSPKGSREAIIKVGDAINLQNYYLDYQNNKTETVEKLTTIVETSVQNNLI